MIILDVMMRTNQEGFEFSRELNNNAEYKDIPILMLTAVKDKTGLDFKPTAGDDAWLPVEDFLDKPVKPDVLVEKVASSNPEVLTAWKTCSRAPASIQRAFWLVRLRWVAVGALAIATFVSGRFMHVSPSRRCRCTPSRGLTLLYNVILCTFGFAHGTRRGQASSPKGGSGAIITLQMSADLLVLATILHFSGGIENPFSFFFVFHMILASILRSRWQSYAQATLADRCCSGGSSFSKRSVSSVTIPWRTSPAHGLYDRHVFVLSGSSLSSP